MSPCKHSLVDSVGVLVVSFSCLAPVILPPQFVFQKGSGAEVGWWENGEDLGGDGGENCGKNILYEKSYFQNKQKTNIVYLRRQSWVKDGGSNLEGRG